MALEIIAVAAAILVLILSGVVLVRNAIGFGKSVNGVMLGVEPKVTHLMEQSEAAQRRAFSIQEGRDSLLLRIPVLQDSLSKLRVIITAAQEAWSPVSRALRYVGLA